MEEIACKNTYYYNVLEWQTNWKNDKAWAEMQKSKGEKHKSRVRDAESYDADEGIYHPSVRKNVSALLSYRRGF